jgi:DNA processing protein
MFAQPSRSLSANEKLDWIRLIRSENVGPRTFARLLERFGSAAAALDALPGLAREGGRGKPLVVASKAVAERELAAWDKLGATLIARAEPSYPPLLSEIDDPPPLLGIKGAPDLVHKPCVGIVGARNASLAGRRFAQELAHELSRSGYVIVSGLARGIDSAAHAGALASGTAAVMAGGLDVIYPPENADLFDRIALQGAIVTEMPPGTQPQASHFPRRNRLVSGLSLGVVVIEATLRSGSLITARMAGEQGREVLAVPGFPTDPRANGPNDLIRNGAALVESVDDVTRILGPLVQRGLREGRKTDFTAEPQAREDEAGVARARPVIVGLLGRTPVSVDMLLRECQFSAAVVSLVLLELELAGRLERQPGGKVSLIT